MIAAVGLCSCGSGGIEFEKLSSITVPEGRRLVSLREKAPGYGVVRFQLSIEVSEATWRAFIGRLDGQPGVSEEGARIPHKYLYSNSWGVPPPEEQKYFRAVKRSGGSTKLCWSNGVGFFEYKRD